MTSGAAKNWCFTKNNYTVEDETTLRALSDTTIKYLVVGKEIGEQGTPHLQGFLQLNDRKRRSQVKNILGECHLTVARFTQNSITYCKKDGDFFEVGVFVEKSNKGKRNDLADFMETVDSGNPNCGIRNVSIFLWEPMLSGDIIPPSIVSASEG